LGFVIWNFPTRGLRASKEGSWEDEKLGSLEVGESFFDVGVIFLWRLGKEGNQKDLLIFEPGSQRTGKNRTGF
jgi:hypothetical protein